VTCFYFSLKENRIGRMGDAERKRKGKTKKRKEMRDSVGLRAITKSNLKTPSR
jgi:hypothetical protein